MRTIALYLHIPYCVKKCNYCDFISVKACEEEYKRYTDAIIEEIRTTAYIHKGYAVTSIFVGGGTPSILSADKIDAIFNAIYSNYSVEKNCEITIEANPGTVTLDKLRSYRKCHINRISFGLQSADNLELKMLGRIHNYEQFIDNYNNARRAGFDNINIDIMSAIPNQSIESYANTLDKVLSIEPEHISAYSLIIEEGTRFYELYEADELNLPLEDDERAMYYMTRERLRERGYDRYEISNYAKSGYECRHNVRYWTRGNYIGYGASAASLFENKRYTNTSDIDRYINSSVSADIIRCEEEDVSVQGQMEEYMFLGLRLMRGVSISEFERNYGNSYEQIYGQVTDKLVSEGLLVRDEDMIRLSERGIDVSNYVMSEFLL